MRKGWDPDKFTQGGSGKNSSCCSRCSFIMGEDIYCLSNYCLCEWHTELLPYSGLKRNTAKIWSLFLLLRGLSVLRGFVSFTTKPDMWREKFLPHPNLVFAGSTDGELILRRSFKDIQGMQKMFSSKSTTQNAETDEQKYQTGRMSRRHSMGNSETITYNASSNNYLSCLPHTKTSEALYDWRWDCLSFLIMKQVMVLYKHWTSTLSSD